VKELLPEIDRWRAQGDRVAIVTVVATRRTAPRPVGSKLAVSASGELVGSVSAGCVEGDVYLAAQEVLAGGAPRLITYGISDDMALGVGLSCGGEIDVFVEPLDVGVLDELRPVLDEGGRAVVLTVVSGEHTGAKLLLGHGGTTVGDGPSELAALAPAALRRGRSHVLEHEGVSIFADVFAPPLRLLVYGAVDAAEALCRAVKLVGWTSVVADARARFATRERLRSADEILVAWPEEAFDQVRPDAGTAVVVLTHDDKFDLPALKAALESEAFYIGALGARRNQERRRERLLEAGVPEAALARIAGPCGLDIGAASSAETALSVLAEMLATRAGRAGGSLRDAKTRIHAELGAGRK
jgi:xanthine dehydrogenase accessory factor